jgi:hypothetical protein
MSNKIKFKLRPHQMEANLALNQRRFNALVCHRRFGKTVLAVGRQVEAGSKTTNPNWRGAYIAPLFRQAKSVAWDYAKFLALPLGARAFESDLSIEFTNGARYCLQGAEDPDKMRGLNFCDVVFDEVGQMPYAAWSKIVLPMLLANDGIALFIGTPQGKNALYEIWEKARLEPELWGRFMYRASETGIITEDSLRIAKSEMEADEYEQEFECSFTAAVRGSYFAAAMEDADRDGRLCDVPYDNALPVHTAWDLGMSDSTSIWFIQARPGGAYAVIDYYEATGEGLDHYAKVLDEKGYKYGQHIAPHDIRVRELGTGKSRLEIARSLGIRFDIAPNIPVQDGINAIRKVIPMCWFDHRKCSLGIDSLRNYRRSFNDKMMNFSTNPVHDWTSHGVDAFRYFAVGFRERNNAPRPATANNSYNPFGRR